MLANLDAGLRRRARRFMVCRMVKTRKKIKAGKWHEKYLPFVAKSPEMRVEWLVNHLARLKRAQDKGKTGILSPEEIKPYIKLLLEDVSAVGGAKDSVGKDDGLRELLGNIDEDELLLMIDCADIYDIPSLLGLLAEVSPGQAIMALKKVPPLFEKNPLMVMDRVFHAIKENSITLLEDSAEGVLASDDAPENFASNYERFREIMMDEHMLSLLYPKAR